MDENMNNMGQQTQIVSRERATAELTKKTQEWISNAIANAEIKCPKGYDYKGELYLAMMMLANDVKIKDGRTAIEVCTPASIMSELKKMVKMGHSLARKHCYAIIYGDKLQITSSYFGDITTIERAIPGAKVHANVLREGDDYEYSFNEETETYEVTGVVPCLENKDNQIVAAFGCVKVNGKKIVTDVMSWKQIQASWAHAKTDNVQKQFPEEMAKRTLIKHMCKILLNTAPGVDSDLVAAYNEATEDEHDFSDMKNVTPPQNDKGAAKFDRLTKEAEDLEPKAEGQEIPF